MVTYTTRHAFADELEKIARDTGDTVLVSVARLVKVSGMGPASTPISGSLNLAPGSTPSPSVPTPSTGQSAMSSVGPAARPPGQMTPLRSVAAGPQGLAGSPAGVPQPGAAGPSAGPVGASGAVQGGQP